MALKHKPRLAEQQNLFAGTPPVMHKIFWLILPLLIPSLVAKEGGRGLDFTCG